MPRTPDRRPGPIVEDEGIFLEPQATEPTVNGELRYVTGRGLRVYEEGKTKSFQPITGSAYVILVRDGNGRAQYIRTFTDSGMATKMEETEITRDGSNRVASVIQRFYDVSGTLARTVTSPVSRSSGKFHHIDRTET